MLSKKNGKRLSNITKEYMINIKSLLINIYSIPSFQKNNNIVCVCDLIRMRSKIQSLVIDRVEIKDFKMDL